MNVYVRNCVRTHTILLIFSDTKLEPTEQIPVEETQDI